MEAFIAEHPGVVVGFIGLLGTALVAVVGAYWTVIAKRLDKLEATDAALGDRVGEVEETLVLYKEKVGAGENMFQTLTSGINNLSSKLSAIHEDNLRAHSAIIERVTKVETKMPNGQLQEVLDIVRGLRGRKV